MHLLICTVAAYLSLKEDTYVSLQKKNSQHNSIVQQKYITNVNMTLKYGNQKNVKPHTLVIIPFIVNTC